MATRRSIRLWSEGQVASPPPWNSCPLSHRGTTNGVAPSAELKRFPDADLAMRPLARIHRAWDCRPVAASSLSLRLPGSASSSPTSSAGDDDHGRQGTCVPRSRPESWRPRPGMPPLRLQALSGSLYSPDLGRPNNAPPRVPQLWATDYDEGRHRPA